jgi:hypothetical protein
MSREFPQQLVRRLLQQLPESRSLERPIGDSAGMVIAVAKEPSFADRSVAGERCFEQLGQPPAAPEPVLVNRLKTQRIQPYLAHAVSFFRLGRLQPCRHFVPKC